MILRELELGDEMAFNKMLNEEQDSSGFNMLNSLIEEISFSTYLSLMRNLRDGKNLKLNEVPVTALYAFVNENIVGKVSVRHYLNSHFEQDGGHIGFGVLENYRVQGLASQMLKGALLYCRSLGLKKVLLTCNDNNQASAKVIVKNGGVLESISEKIHRYWIDLSDS